jgi:hypothetical protein
MIEAGLLKILGCPETHQELRPEDAALVEKLNRQISAGGSKNRGDRLLPADEAISLAS